MIMIHVLNVYSILRIGRRHIIMRDLQRNRNLVFAYYLWYLIGYKSLFQSQVHKNIWKFVDTVHQYSVLSITNAYKLSYTLENILIVLTKSSWIISMKCFITTHHNFGRVPLCVRWWWWMLAIIAKERSIIDMFDSSHT